MASVGNLERQPELGLADAPFDLAQEGVADAELVRDGCRCRVLLVFEEGPKVGIDAAWHGDHLSEMRRIVKWRGNFILRIPK